jgi:hypothetical protein
MIYIDDDEDDIVDVTPRATSPSMMLQRIHAGIRTFAENTQPTPKKLTPFLSTT